jgi:parallel beta-helix repeat protein
LLNRQNRLFVSFCCAFIFLLFHPQECLTKTIQVPVDYSTIQQALNSASPGDTVKVAEGKYRENIYMRAGINLVGAGAEKSKIKPVNNTTDIPTVVAADQCVLEGFTFLGASKNSPAAILVENVSPTIRNNVIKKNMTAGILVKYKRANPVIKRNVIYKNKLAGIKIVLCGGRVTANEVFGNVGPGISLLDAYPIIEGNYIYQNNETGITTGVGQIKKASEESREAFIYKNRIEYNNAGGIATEKSSPSIIANSISNKGKPAILLFSSNSVIKDNVLISNGPPAVRINSSSSPIVEKNIIEGTLRFAIMNDSRTARIRNNTINSKWTPGMPVK